jgi:hypothetical protein
MSDESADQPRNARIARLVAEIESDIAAVQSCARSAIGTVASSKPPSQLTIMEATVRLGRAKVGVANLVKELRGVLEKIHRAKLGQDSSTPVPIPATFPLGVTRSGPGEPGVGTKEGTQEGLERERAELQSEVDRLVADVRALDPIITAWRSSK